MIDDKVEFKKPPRVGIPISVLFCLSLFGIGTLGCASEENVTRMQTQAVGIQRSSIGPLGSKEIGSMAIRRGDEIQISVWGYPEFNTSGSVKEEGTVIVPLVGEIKAAGLTKEEFTSQLKTHLAEYIKEDARVTVAVASVAGSKVHVMGAVTRQENYPVVGDVSLVEIITSAGGAIPEADLSHVKIYRNGIGKNAINVDLSKHMERGDIDAIPKVRPGDTVFIPRQENLMRGVSDFVRDVLVMLGFFRFLN